MSELHRFLFEGLPVRGAVVRLTHAWTDMLRRRSANTSTGPYPVRPSTAPRAGMAACSTRIRSNP